MTERERAKLCLQEGVEQLDDRGSKGNDDNGNETGISNDANGEKTGISNDDNGDQIESATTTTTKHGIKKERLNEEIQLCVFYL